MAIKGTRSLAGEISVEEFREWMKKFDTNNDGRISKAELRRAIRSRGGRFSSWKSAHGLRVADKNHNGYIDENEIDNLIMFAEKYMGMKITT